MQVVGDGHADAQGQAVGVGGADDVFDARLGEGVEAAAEVGRVGLGEGRAGESVAGVVVLGGVDACGLLLVLSFHIEYLKIECCLHPVAMLVRCTPLSWHSSANIRVPITLLRTVSTLLSSHQSTLGRPVLPAQLIT